MPTPLIDGHTHVFNVGFLPVEGVMRAHHVPKIIARGVTHVLERLLERELPAPHALTEEEEGRQALMAMLEAELHAVAAPPRAMAFDEPDLITRVAQLVPERDLEALRQVLAESEPEISPDTRAITAMRMPPAAAAAPDRYADDRRRLANLLREAARYGGAIENDEETVASLTALSARGIIDWLLLLVQHESRIVKSFPGAWTPAQDFALSVHHMMDMAPHYPGRPPVYPFATEQLRRMRAVAETAPVPLVGFVAYSPRRPEWESIIDDALAHGFIGVKFYPPSGYRPIDNSDSDVGGGITGKTVDERNLQLFRKCGSRVPIFTHCTRGGVEVRKNVTGEFSNPKHWRDVLGRPGLSDLRLCLGHAGGQDGWMAAPGPTGDNEWKDSYAHEVVELCVTYDNIYCDFGYFDHLLAGDGAAYFKARLEAAVTRYGERFAKKCCYGTDWHLMSVQREAAEYPDRFAQLLRSSKILESYAEDILGRNALRYLDLPGFLERSGAALADAERSRLEELAGAIHSLSALDSVVPDGKGLDTTQDVTGVLAQLSGAGYSFVARYYSHNAWKTVKALEAQAIGNAGIDLVAVWQDANDSPGYFTRERGERDGTAAFAYARQIGQPEGSTIYFAVDYDASDADVKGRLVDYFAGVRASFVAAGNGNATYDIGVYGSGAVCAGLLAQKLASRSWLALASGWRGYGTFKDWNLKQSDETSIFGLTADPDRARGDHGGFRPSVLAPLA